MDVEKTVRYLSYLQTDQWALQRASALARSKYRCTTCGGWKKLQVHHLTYARLGAELPQDLTVLCETCHHRLHAHEDVSKLFGARLDGWASKVYGDDWREFADYGQVVDRFESWLSRRGYDY